MLTIFEYEYRDTWLHRLIPVSKLYLIICLSIVSSLYWDPRLIFIVFLVSSALYLTSKTPKKWMILALLFASFKLVEAVIVGASLADPRYFRTIPPELAGAAVFRADPFELRY